MIIKDKIKATTTYGTLDGIQQLMLLKKSSIEVIRHGFRMSGLTSFENWVAKTSPKKHIKGIVQELVLNEETPN